MTSDFRRYLRAKRSVDDRALDRRVLATFREAAAERAVDGPLRVLEVGAGIGTMLARFLEWDALPTGEISYTAVDVDADTVAGIEPYLREWAEGRDVSVSATGGKIALKGSERTVELGVVAEDAVAYAGNHPGEFDALVGSALLDILELDALEPLLGALSPGGVYYFPITFDGATRFYPAHPADRDIERRYHDHMDAKPGGSSRAGGEVLASLRATAGVTVSAVGGSDWIVRPIDGVYPADEAYFLRFVLDTVEEAVGEMLAADGSDAVALDEWLARRREQLAAGELLYLTHQLDLSGRVEKPIRTGDLAAE